MTSYNNSNYSSFPLTLQKYELAPNVMLMVQSFNRLALLVTTEILAEKTPQARAKVIGNFIKVKTRAIVGRVGGGGGGVNQLHV